jgi:hypothetical protein
MQGLLLTTDEGEQALTSHCHLGSSLLAQITLLILWLELPPEGLASRERSAGRPVEEEQNDG